MTKSEKVIKAAEILRKITPIMNYYESIRVAFEIVNAIEDDNK